MILSETKTGHLPAGEARRSRHQSDPDAASAGITQSWKRKRQAPRPRSDSVTALAAEMSTESGSPATMIPLKRSNSPRGRRHVPPTRKPPTRHLNGTPVTAIATDHGGHADASAASQGAVAAGGRPIAQVDAEHEEKPPTAADPGRGWCRRQIREVARAAREACGLTRQQAADALDWSPSKLVRIEAGKAGISVTDLKALLGLYQVGPPETEALAALARGTRQRPWFARYPVAAAVPGLALYLDAETSAAAICGYQASAVPDLLQTPDYARAFLLREHGPARVGELTELLLARQRQLLDRDDGPQLSYIVDEAALRRHADTTVMRGQLGRLAAAAGHPRISVRVVPFTCGAYPQPGPYTIIGLPDGAWDAVYLDAGGGSLIRRTGREEIQRYRGYFGAAYAKSAALPSGGLPIGDGIS